MKSSFRLLLGLLTLASCRHTATDTPTPAEDPDWLKLEIPGGREANAIAGDLDGTLQVTTYKDAYISTDRGLTWQKTMDFYGPVSGLVARHDTLVALNARGGDIQQPYAAVGNHFSTDQGRTWQHTSSLTDPQRTLFNLQQPIGFVQTAAGLSYQIRFNYTPAPGVGSYYVEPSDLLRLEAGATSTLRLPAKKLLRNLHLDGQNRLYVGVAPCATKQDVRDCPECQPENGLQSPAVVYVSRKPLP